MSKDTPTSQTQLEEILLKGFKDFATYANMGLNSKLPYPSTADDYEKALRGVVGLAVHQIEALISKRIEEANHKFLSSKNPYTIDGEDMPQKKAIAVRHKREGYERARKDFKQLNSGDRGSNENLHSL